MSIKEIKEAMDEGKAVFGIRQVLKAQGVKKGNAVLKDFVAKNARDKTLEDLEKAGVEYEVLKMKEEIAKDLNLDFECEVYLIR